MYEKIKPNVKKNDRIELIRTDDQFTSLKTGDKGTVVDVQYLFPFKEWQIFIMWDDGSTLSLIYGIDKYKVILS